MSADRYRRSDATILGRRLLVEWLAALDDAATYWEPGRYEAPELLSVEDLATGEHLTLAPADRERLLADLAAAEEREARLRDLSARCTREWGAS